ncbi:hypothetical protein Calab_3213 [Caldithrix abyssi DSM 13497]|uniref:FlgD/Vpr Ig-like domain-containing protein n=2 Tax=Caldithrix abyssi DSM 13497 TaxID=880073 RepID=H1XUY6_CALAY|nr:FlgD immunoglobulin-like domain containing protein [Caldithrix abyssi]EHO42819.1 hypothetical protein Calab_3213 [Caldithrix abyssi DSM 13497]
MRIFFLQILLFSIMLNPLFSQQYSIIVDGDPSDWESNDGNYNYTTSLSLHQSNYFNGQWIYKGKIGDARDLNNENYDMWELRIGQDGTYLYILIKLNDITDINLPNIAFAFSTGSGGTANWIGDEANTFIEGTPNIDFNVILHTGTSGIPTAEFWDITGGISWYTPSGVQVAISTTNDVVEARLPLASLEISPGENFTFWCATFLNEITTGSDYWANNGDCTNDWGGSSTPDAVDGMSEGWSIDENWWNRAEFDDGNNDIENTNGATILFNDASLPVTLNSFTAAASGQSVLLQWTTQSEIDVLGFEIQRALDENGPFETIATYKDHPQLKASGSSSAETAYRFIDQNVQPNFTYWYKLISHDLDGSRQTFGPISATVQKDGQNLQPIAGNTPTEFMLEQNFPNPFNGSTQIAFSIPALKEGSANVQLNVFDINGKLIDRLINQTLSAGTYQVKWDGRDLRGNKAPSGVYIYQLRANNFVFSKKMLLVQ